MKVNDLVLYPGDLFRVEQVGVPSEVLEGDCYEIMGLNKRRIMITVTEEDIVRRIDQCIR